MKAISASLMAICLCMSSPLWAGTWQNCLLDLQILAPETKGEVTGKVTKVTPRPGSAECPKRGEVISFAPEARDYQSMLPHKQWPKVGSSYRLRYIYLDGICKNDGNPKPCRIAHYPAGH